jgi:hypothetical protein
MIMYPIMYSDLPSYDVSVATMTPTDTVKSPYLTLEPDFYCRLPELNVQLWHIIFTSYEAPLKGTEGTEGSPPNLHACMRRSTTGYCIPYVEIDQASIAEMSRLFHEIGLDSEETDALVDHICDYVMNDYDVKRLTLPTWDLKPTFSTKHLSWMHLCWGDYTFNLHADVFSGECGHLECGVPAQKTS